MKLISLHVGAFGSLKDRTFQFSEALQLIVGENESGKSTLCAAIRFLHY